MEGKSSMGAVILFEDITRFVKVAERQLRKTIKTAKRSRTAEADATRAVKPSNRARSQAGGAAKPSVRGAPGNAFSRSKRTANGGAASLLETASAKKASLKEASGKRPAQEKRTLS
jgi:hypothetical protein